MMQDLLSRLFRSLNSRMTAARSPLYRKIFKASFLISAWALRANARRNGAAPPAFRVIDNFDRTIKMRVDRHRYIGAALYWTGFHELKEFFFLQTFLTPDMTFVDVGANQGEYTLFAAKRLTSGRVFSFEPLASVREQLETNIRLNGFSNVTVFACGLSDQPGRLAIHEIGDQNEGLATFFPEHAGQSNAFEVELDTLDGIVERQAIARIDFVKMDIEGSELRALMGAEAVLRKFRPLVMVEINEKSFAAAGYERSALSQFFDRLGYAAFAIDKNGLLVPCRELPVMANIVFAPR